MTFTRLKRQRKDVRNVECKEEEERYYLSGNYLKQQHLDIPKPLMNKQIRIHHSLP